MFHLAQPHFTKPLLGCNPSRDRYWQYMGEYLVDQLCYYWHILGVGYSTLSIGCVLAFIDTKVVMKMREEQLLLIDDEPGIIRMMETLLRKEGFSRIASATTGSEALRLIGTRYFDLVVLDVMLPDADGFDLCRSIRQITMVPIIFVTARSGDLDKVMGLGFGGDDYVTKPFFPLELVARIEAQLRRQRAYKSPSAPNRLVLDYGCFVVNKSSGQLIVSGIEVPCPAKEFELLTFLCEHPNQVFTTAQLYDRVWGTFMSGDEKTVVIHISRLRKKLEEDPAAPKIIINSRGIGYRFIPPGMGRYHEI